MNTLELEGKILLYHEYLNDFCKIINRDMLSLVSIESLGFMTDTEPDGKISPRLFIKKLNGREETIKGYRNPGIFE